MCITDDFVTGALLKSFCQGKICQKLFTYFYNILILVLSVMPYTSSLAYLK